MFPVVIFLENGRHHYDHHSSLLPVGNTFYPPAASLFSIQFGCPFWDTQGVTCFCYRGRRMAPNFLGNKNKLLCAESSKCVPFHGRVNFCECAGLPTAWLYCYPLPGARRCPSTSQVPGMGGGCTPLQVSFPTPPLHANSLVTQACHFHIA